MRKSTGTSRTARHAATSPPRKSIAQLARKQGVPSTPPDYVALFSKVWRTRAEVDEFQESVLRNRRASAG